MNNDITFPFKEYKEDKQITIFLDTYYFVLRDNKVLYTKWTPDIDKHIKKGESYCCITQTPSTPPDKGLTGGIKGDQSTERTIWDMNLLCYEGIKAFLEGKPLKNWYDN